MICKIVIYVNSVMEWIENITLTPSMDIYEDTMRIDVGIGINGVSLTTASAVWDLESQSIYIGIPELSDAYVEFDATELFGSDAASFADALASYREFAQVFVDAMPTSEQVKELINKYYGIVIEGITEAEKENETVKIGSVKQELLVITAKLSQKDILNVAASVLDAVEKDETIEDIINNFEDSIVEFTGEEPADLYETFSDAVEDAQDELDALIDEAERSNFLTLETYFDDKDNVVGYSTTVKADGEELTTSTIMVTDGKKWAVESIADTIYVFGKGSVKDNKYTGSITVSVDDTDLYTIELDDYFTENGSTYGTCRLIPESALLESMDLDSTASIMLEQAALELVFEGESINIGIEFAGKQLFSFALSGEIDESGKISIPESIDSEDEAAGEEWLSQLNFDAILNNLEKAGVPSEYMDIAEEAIDSFLDEFN